MGERDDTVKLSNEWRKGKQMYKIAGTFGVITLGFAITGIYLTITEDNWIFLLIFGIIAGIFGIITFFTFPSKNTEIYSIEIQKDGIYQKWENEAKNESSSEFFSFNDVNDVLIGIFEQINSGYEGRDWYTIKAMLIIKHNDEYFFKIINQQDELHIWIDKLEGKVPPIRYIDYDFSKAFYSRVYMEIDFTMAVGTNEDTISEHVGREFYEKSYYEWMPEELYDELEEKKKEINKPKTRKAELTTVFVLLIYNTLFAAFIFPHIPIDDDGIIAFSDQIYYGYMIVNFILPMIFVYWRSFTKWYMPLLFVLAGITGNFIGTALASLTNEILFNLFSIILLNFVNLLLWIAGLIVVRLFKFVFSYMDQTRMS